MTASRTLLWLALAASPASAQTTSANPYERGRALIEAEDVEGALTLWIAARDSLSAAGAEDPRIATAFAEAVAEHELERFAEIAAEMFYWGFSGRAPFSEPAREEILAEGRRTFALVDSTVAEFWAETGRDDPGALSLGVKRFWIERDPTPATPLNERLIEHWRRVVFARRNFTYNYSSPYRTDDRGIFHVKYGEPDRITRGSASISASEQREYGVSIDFVAQFDRAPQYEIWRYATLHPGEFTYFLFGNTDGTGPFGHVEGLHRILPSGARLPASANPRAPQSRRREIRPWYYMELFYYDDLARMGGPFGLRFAELERLWNRSREPNEGTLEATSQRYIDDDQWAALQPRPPSASELDDGPKSALSAQAARVLDDAEPRILVLAVSSPLWRPTVEPTERGDSLVLAPYSARNTVIARDRRLHEVTRAGMVPVDGRGNLATMVLRHTPAMVHVTVTAEHEVEEDSAEGLPGVLPGRVHFAMGEPLLRRTAEPEVSDLIVGIAPQPDFELGDVPVPLLPASQFWRDDLLRVYFEIYHGTDTPAGAARNFDVRVRIVPAGDFVARMRGRPPGEDAVSAAVSLSLESTAPTGTHFLDLDLRNEDPGPLWVVLEVTDEETGAARLRATPIRLLEN